MWLIVIVASAVSAALGYVLLDPASGHTGALVQCFAAGALLAMITDTMLPVIRCRTRLHGFTRRYRIRGLADALGDLSNGVGQPFFVGNS